MNRNNLVKYPCKECTKRSKPDEPNCHGYCKEYLAAKAKANELSDKMYKAKQFNYMADYYGRA